MTRRLFPILFLLATMPLSFGQSPAESPTGIEGVVTIGPIQPGPAREGVPSSAPLANAAFDIANEKGVVTSLTTDAQGRFQISLAPGHYTITQRGKTGIRACGPFDVDVVAGKMTSVQWECDTGMR